MLILSLFLLPPPPVNLSWTEVCVGVYACTLSACLCGWVCTSSRQQWAFLKFRGDDESAMFAPGKVRASYCINNGSTAGSIYSNSGREPWQRKWEVIYEIQYIMPALPDIRQCDFPHGMQCWTWNRLIRDLVVTCTKNTSKHIHRNMPRLTVGIHLQAPQYIHSSNLCKFKVLHQKILWSENCGACQPKLKAVTG